MIGAGHAYADILDYTLAQIDAFLAAIERQESRQLASLLSVIGTDLMKFELSGQVLADLTKPAAGALGQFGRIVLL